MAYDLADRSSHVKRLTATPFGVEPRRLAPRRPRPTGCGERTTGSRTRPLAEVCRPVSRRWDFLKGWRARFGDATVAQDATARAWNLARRKGEHELLLDLAQRKEPTGDRTRRSGILRLEGGVGGSGRLADPAGLHTNEASGRAVGPGALKADDAAGCLCVLEDGAAVSRAAACPPLSSTCESRPTTRSAATRRSSPTSWTCAATAATPSPMPGSWTHSCASATWKVFAGRQSGRLTRGSRPPPRSQRGLRIAGRRSRNCTTPLALAAGVPPPTGRSPPWQRSRPNSA